MVNSVSSDKIPSQNTVRSNTMEERRAEHRPQQVKSDVGVIEQTGLAGASAPDDSLRLSRAGTLISKTTEQAGRGENNLESAAQASALVNRIRQQFESSPEQAFKAQAGDQVGQYITLLQTAPA